MTFSFRPAFPISTEEPTYEPELYNLFFQFFSQVYSKTKMKKKKKNGLIRILMTHMLKRLIVMVIGHVLILKF